MRKRSRDSLPGMVAPVLTAPILSGIHQLNRDYVELLVADRSAGYAAKALPPAVIDGLRALSPQARAALAACPFALYALGIEQQDFWRHRVADNTVASDAAGAPPRAALTQAASFAISAMFFAWHVASSQRVAARVLYALCDGTIDMLVPLPLAELQRIAGHGSGLLMPRWPGNCAFWPDLIRFAALGDMQRLTTTQLLGSQLIAADLRANAAARGVLRPVAVGVSAVARDAR